MEYIVIQSADSCVNMKIIEKDVRKALGGLLDHGLVTVSFKEGIPYNMGVDHCIKTDYCADYRMDDRFER